MSGIKSQQPGINLEPHSRIASATTTAFTVQPGVEVVTVDTTSGVMVITLPRARLYIGKTLTFIGISLPNPMTYVATVPDTILGTIFVLNDGDAFTIMGISDTEWAHFSFYPPGELPPP